MHTLKDEPRAADGPAESVGLEWLKRRYIERRCQVRPALAAVIADFAFNPDTSLSSHPCFGEAQPS